MTHSYTGIWIIEVLLSLFVSQSSHIDLPLFPVWFQKTSFHEHVHHCGII